MRRPRTPRRPQSAREAFQAAFDRMGGAEALAAWGLLKPADFYRLFARLIPLGAGEAGEDPTRVEIVRFSDPDADDQAA